MSSTPNPKGLPAAINVIGPGEAPKPEGEQLALMPEASGGDLERQDAANAEPRGPGRPKGARNKRTAENVHYIQRQYGMPLEVLAKMWSGQHPNMKYMKMGEKLDVMRQAAVAGLPYMHQKLPIEVDVNKDARVQITIGHLSPDVAALAEQDGLSRSLAEITGQTIDGEIVGDESEQ